MASNTGSAFHKALAPLLAAFITLEVCRLDSGRPLYFEATGRIMHIDPDLIAGYEEFPSIEGIDCVMLLLLPGQRRYVVSTPDLKALLSRARPHP